jgi:isoquinoline 1-oxidoreductase beta subunit
MGLSAALHEGIVMKNSRVENSDFDGYTLMRMADMRMAEAPVVETHIIRSVERIGGVDEPRLPPAAPKMVNAIFAATGKRVSSLPVDRTDLRT